MYSRCLFCGAGLGVNAGVRRFPVGRRLAFDARRDRLWAICVRCGGWCLAPIEERWEAIEECERLFRGAHLRASTTNVSLAYLSDGLALVRVGAPVGSELALWRYGAALRRRYRVTDLARAAGLTGAAALLTAGSAGLAGIVLGGAGALVVWTVRQGPLADVRLVVRSEPPGWGIAREGAKGEIVSVGPEAVRILSAVLGRAHRRGASADTIDYALAKLAIHPSPNDYITFGAQVANMEGRFADRARRGMLLPVRSNALVALSAPDRLALHMALIEDRENRALAGELEDLEAEWREAEHIAAIADSL